MVRSITQTISPPFKHDYATLFFPSTVPTPFSNLSNLHVKTNTSPPEPLIECVDTDDCSPPTPTSLSHSLLKSDVYSFFGVHLKVHLSLVGFKFK